MRGGMKMMAAARARNDGGDGRQGNYRNGYGRNDRGSYGDTRRRNGFQSSGDDEDMFEMEAVEYARGGGFERNGRQYDMTGYERNNGRYNMAGEGSEMARRRGYDGQRRDLWHPDMRTPYLSIAGGYEMQGENMERMDRNMAQKWADHMQNADGSRGGHWTAEQIRPFMQQAGFAGSPDEFYVMMNAMFSDFYKVAKKYNLDRPEFYADLAKAWLEDPDAMEDKAALYYRYIVKK